MVMILAIASDGAIRTNPASMKSARAAAADANVKRATSSKVSADDEKLKVTFIQIDRELAARVNSSEVGPNMQGLLKLLEFQLDTSGVPTTRLDALQLLAALQRVWDKSLACRSEAFVILAKNTKILGGIARVSTDSSTHEPLSRLRTIVHKIALGHARHCKSVYPKLYHELKRKVPLSARQTIRVFFDRLADRHIRNERVRCRKERTCRKSHKFADAMNAPKILAAYHRLDGQLVARVAYEFLKHSVHGDPDQRFLNPEPLGEAGRSDSIVRAKVQAFAERHLIEPCKQYAFSLGLAVFEPSEFDAKILHEPETPDDRNLKPSLVDFLAARVRFNLCKKLVFRDRVGFLKNIATIRGRGAS